MIRYALFKETAMPQTQTLGSTEREAWIRLALQYLRVRRARLPAAAFTAEDVAIEMLVHQYPKPRDTRWWGAVMQRAKRESIIFPYYALGMPIKAPTRAGHLTPVWCYTRTT